ncbi:MAG TPA: nicotinate-nucleotide adenylyltransferase [Micropepsaceae bacterium]|nr:nicotinate-nucleotide adenylyltransferase [Micropepsaceae bacterium]
MKNIRTKSDWIAPPGPVESGLRIGLLGGSFNPAHEGHRHASELALKQLGLDYVWWLVSPQNPLKDTRGMASLADRLQAAQHFNRHPRIIVTDIESRLGTRFTLDTLRALKRRFPQLRLVWLMGSDNLLQIPRWRNWQQIFASVPVTVIARPGTALTALSSKAATCFRSAYVPPNRHIAVMSPPAWTMIDVRRRNPSSATLLRKNRASRN